MKKPILKRFRIYLTGLFLLFLICSCGTKGSPGSGATGTDDPLLNQQWHIKNTGQKAFSTSGGVSGEDLHLSTAIADGLTGKGITIAISDSGTQEAHEDLHSNILSSSSRNYKLNANNTPGLESPWLGNSTPSTVDMEVDYELNHGTAVAGIIGAIASNGIGGRGIAPIASLIPFRFIGALQTIEKFVDQAKGVKVQNGQRVQFIDIFNYSYGYPTCVYTPIDSNLKAQIELDAAPGTNNRGVIYVKAAGNEFISSLDHCSGSPSSGFLGNANFDGINTLPEVIVVGALAASGVVSSYSSPGANIWVSAPGGEFGDTSPAIVTTDYEGCNYGYSKSSNAVNSFESGGDSLNSGCKYTSTMNGTSSATPNTAGAIALLLEANPLLKPRDVKSILAKTARRVDPTSGNSSHPGGANLDLTGHTYQQGWVANAAGVYFHNRYGFGAVDVDAAIAMAKNSYTPLGALQTSEATSAALSLPIPDASATGVSSTLTIADNLKIESVEVNFSITHPKTSNLGVEITSPSNTKSILMNINSLIVQPNFTDAHFITNAFLDESSNGTWTLKVIDGYTANTGTLTYWKIKINGHASKQENKKGDFLTKSPLYSIFESFRDYFTNS